MSNSKLRTVGVIGGMGPAATLEFASTVMSVSGAERDEDHVPMLIDNNTQIPNRQVALLGNGESPGPAIAATGKRLQDAGADFLVMPCNTAHAFIDELLEAVSIPFLSIIDVAVEASRQYSRVGVIATAGCLRFGGYQQALTEQGLQPVVPDDYEVRDLSALVLRIKTGDVGQEVRELMRGLVLSLQDKGCDAIVSACTEIPMALDDADIPCPVICSTRELAIATVRYARDEQ